MTQKCCSDFKKVFVWSIKKLYQKGWDPKSENDQNVQLTENFGANFVVRPSSEFYPYTLMQIFAGGVTSSGDNPINEKKTKIDGALPRTVHNNVV